jgi:hypothetical protein
MRIKSFRRWLEDIRHDPEEMRKTIISYLTAEGKALAGIQPKEVPIKSIRELDMEIILKQLEGLDLYANNPNKDQAMQALSRGNATFGDFLDALTAGPSRMVQGSSSMGDAGGL